MAVDLWCDAAIVAGGVRLAYRAGAALLGNQ